MFAWSETLDALAPPRRGQGPPILATRQMGRVRLFRSALKARAPGYEPRASLVRLMRTGVGDLADEADAFLLACSAPRRGTGVGKLSGLSEVEAAKVAFAAVDRWVQLRGLVCAVEIFSLVGAWRPVPLFSDEHARVLAAIRLRQWLAHSAEYDAALALVERSDGLPNGMRGWRTSAGYDAGREAIAYLFPDHRPFFVRAADELEAHGARSTLLLGAIASTDDHDRIAIGDADLDRNALVIARELREDGLPRLIDHARRAARPTARGVLLALGAYVPSSVIGVGESWGSRGTLGAGAFIETPRSTSRLRRRSSSRT